MNKELKKALVILGCAKCKEKILEGHCYWYHSETSCEVTTIMITCTKCQ